VMVGLLDLRQLDERSFVGAAAPERAGRMYGGQLLAQGLAAAQRCVDDDRPVHSLHGYFLRAGSVDRPVELVVTAVRDGRSFSVREVSVGQDGDELMRLLASFHVPEDGLDYSPARQYEVPPPEAVTVTYDQFTRAHQPDPDEEWPGADRPMDIRYINAPRAPEGQPVLEPQLMWVRISEELPDDPRIHAAALAYLADSTLVDHVMLPHGLRWQDGRLTGASLDHAMWFHRPARADRWLLYDQQVEATAGARGMTTGRLIDSDGVVVTCGQEGLMRWGQSRPAV